MSDILEKTFNDGHAEGLVEGRAEGRAEGLTVFISVLAEMEFSSDAIISKIAEKFGMSKDEASKEYEKYV